jgi:hypothetical protein
MPLVWEAAAIGVSCRDATGTNTMTETVTVAKPVSRPRSRKPATVSASALALHLDCSRKLHWPGSKPKA